MLDSTGVRRAPTLRCKTLACMRKAVSRGLCGYHYSTLRPLVVNGLTTWQDLESKGLALPSTYGQATADLKRVALGLEQRAPSASAAAPTPLVAAMQALNAVAARPYAALQTRPHAGAGSEEVELWRKAWALSCGTATLSSRKSRRSS